MARRGDGIYHSGKTCWLDSWRGIGAVERAMAHQGFDLQLTRYDERGWRATFYTTGDGTRRRARPAPGRSARRGTRPQRAAWEALKRSDSSD